MRWVVMMVDRITKKPVQFESFHGTGVEALEVNRQVKRHGMYVEKACKALGAFDEFEYETTRG